MKLLRRKIVGFIIILTFSFNLLSIINSLTPITHSSNSKVSSNIPNIEPTENSRYNYWYNYTIHLINNTGVFREEWTTHQYEIIENISWTYYYRELGLFNDPKYNNYDYWEGWVWDNMIALYYPNITHDAFYNQVYYAEETMIRDFVTIYWGLMINNYTIEEADQLFHEATGGTPYAEAPNPSDSSSSIIIANDYYTKCEVRLVVTMFCIIHDYTLSIERFTGTSWSDFHRTSVYGDFRLIKFLYSVQTRPYKPGPARFHVDYIGYSSFFVWHDLYDVWHHEFMIEDDDPNPPYEEESYQDISGSVCLDDSENMYFKFQYRDAIESEGDYSNDQGLFVEYQYRYYPEATIYSFSSSTVENTLFIDCQIPKSEWSTKIEQILQYRHRARDMDDEEGPLDYAWSDWTNWRIVGKIYENPEGSIMQITQKAIKLVGQSWVWYDLDIYSEEQTNEIIEIYAGQPLDISFFVSNPTSQNLYLRGIDLNFDIGGPTLLTIPLWTEPSSYPEGYYSDMIPSSENGRMYDLTNIILDSDLFLGIYSLQLVTISGLFEYSIGSTSSFVTSSFLQTYTLIKPPEPSINYIGFEGPKEGANFIYKTDAGDLSSIHACFQVINGARVPIRTSQVLDFEPNWYSEDQNPESGMNWASLLDIQGDHSNPVKTIVNPGQWDIYVALDVTSPIFFADIPGLAPFDAISKILYSKLLWDCFREWLEVPMLLETVITYAKYAKIVKGAVGILAYCLAVMVTAFEAIMLGYVSSSVKDTARSYVFENRIRYEGGPLNFTAAIELATNLKELDTKSKRNYN